MSETKSLEEWAEEAAEHGIEIDVEGVKQAHRDVASFDSGMTVDEIAEMVALTYHELPDFLWKITEASKRAIRQMEQEQEDAGLEYE